ncbi:MAG: DUF3052 domain-containing protein [Microthrixaceae bacterium]
MFQRAPERPTPRGPRDSGTPLVRKIGIKAGHRAATVDASDELGSLLVDLPDGVDLGADTVAGADIVMAFYTERSCLESDLTGLADAVFPDRVLWLAWPKKASGVETDLTGDVVRATGSPPVWST